jgi:hypothetical protein
MITYKKTGISPDILHLISKLPEPWTHEQIIIDIEHKFLSVIEVCYDDKRYGILIARGEINRLNEWVYVICGVVAEDDLNIHLMSILKHSLENWLSSFKPIEQFTGWKKIRMFADLPIFSKLYTRNNFIKTTEVFEKRIICQAEAVEVKEVHKAAKQPQVQPQAKM